MKNNFSTANLCLSAQSSQAARKAWSLVWVIKDLHLETTGNIQNLVGEKGTLYISIYNDQGRKSRIWKQIKKLYNSCPRALRFFIVIPCFCWLWFPTFIYDLLRLKPFYTWMNYNTNRGMTPWSDAIIAYGRKKFRM